MRSEKQRLGRKRDSRVDHAIVTATRELLVEHGYARLTVDAVAARAGIGKAAIYRRYASRQEMVFASVVHDEDIVAPPDSGSLRGDLSALLDEIVAQLANPAAAAAVPALLSDVTADPGLAARFRQRFIARQQECLAELLDRAVARGELPTRPTIDIVHAQLLGPVFAWHFLLRNEPSGDFTIGHVDGLVASLTE